MRKILWEKRAKGSVTTPLGFVASGMHCGIKKRKKVYDCSLIVSKKPAIAAGTFTINRVKAWPVLQSMKAIQGVKHRAILASSGNANCVNGPKGKVAVSESVAELARHLKVAEEEILIAQTGLIGAPFPVTRFKRAIPTLVAKLSKDGSHDAALGILTTDRSAKEMALSLTLGGKRVTIAALAKGAGMVHPNMATMLCFITTDAAITKPLLKRAVRHAVDDTFNQMAIDNDMSTNDTVFILANGEAGNPLIQRVDRDYRLFREVLEQLCRTLAFEMIRDGEGVTHVCTLRVQGARNPTQAEKAARHIANSMLVKTMLAGADPNWGRIVAAIGASGVDFDYDALNINFDDVNVIHHGRVRALNLPKARRVLQRKTYVIDINLGKGRGRTEFIMSDLTTKYVTINASYS